MKRTTRWTWLALLGATSSAGCSDSGTGGANGPGGDGPLFTVPVTQFGPDSQTSGLLTTERPEVPVLLSLDRAIELPGAAATFGSERARSVIIGTSDAPTLTRYV